MSSYLNYDSQVYDKLTKSTITNPPKLLWFHGNDDEEILHKWGVATYQELTRLGVPGEFHTMIGIKHEIRMEQLLKVEKWARQLLPPLTSDLNHKL